MIPIEPTRRHDFEPTETQYAKHLRPAAANAIIGAKGPHFSELGKQRQPRWRYPPLLQLFALPTAVGRYGPKAGYAWEDVL